MKLTTSLLSISIFLILGLEEALAQEIPQLEQEARNAKGLKIAQTGQAAYTGEFFRVAGRKVQLLRSLDKIAVRYPPSEGFSVMSQLQTIAQREDEFLVEQEIPEQGITVLQTSKFDSLGELDDSIRRFEQTFGVLQAVPVYIHEESGLELIPTDEFIVKLAEGASLAELEGFNEGIGVIMVRSLGGTIDQFILSIPDCTPEELLSTCEIYWQDPTIEWAQPNFLAQVEKCDFQPNDPRYSEQWHLPKIQAPKAWETTKGSSQVVIAVIDDGMDLEHEDLKPNLWNNNLEIANNGVDDDNNGYVDDRNGWNFFDYDPDPNPSHSDDNHGTSCAGVAAAKGNNNRGVASCAFNCTLMPLKLMKGSEPFLIARSAESIYYAAGRTKNGGSWRGADIISRSLSGSEFDLINDALNFATSQGRGGKGCPIFCSAGNAFDGWIFLTHAISFPSIGNYTLTIQWTYVKDASGIAGDDAIWLDEVIFPDGTVEGFEEGLPASSMTSSGDAAWKSVQNGIGGNHAKTGRRGQNARAIRSGNIGDNMESFFRLTKDIYIDKPGERIIGYQVFLSCEFGDGLHRVIINGKDYGFGESGEANLVTGLMELETAIGYPASHPTTIAVGASTDFDYRADYSRYGSELDFVAPSNGGIRAITTTDRTGSKGYNPLNYTSTFGGTSSSAPLAAGVAALMLSRNQNLTAEQVRKIMQNTCDKIDSVPYNSSSWNQYYGYGRINAKKAVDEAVKMGSLKVTITPQEAVNAGARWRRAGTNMWRTSGDTETGIQIGMYKVEFNSVSGWTKPDDITVIINKNQITNGTAEYTGEPSLLTVTSPNGDESWQRGTTQTITWSKASNTGSNVKIELYKGGVFNSTIHSYAPNSGSYDWQIPSTLATGSDYKVKITSTLNSSYNDESDRSFWIIGTEVPSITVTSPNGREIWQRGTQHKITWISSGNIGSQVSIELYKGGLLSTIVQWATPNDGSYDWDILRDQVIGTDYKIKIRSISNNSYYDYSNGDFSIIAP